MAGVVVMQWRRKSLEKRDQNKESSGYGKGHPHVTDITKN